METVIKTTSEIKVAVLGVQGNDQWVVGAMKVLPNIPPPEVADRGRIRYLMQHRHGTPFEHNSISILVHAPIFLWREWHRHRIGFSYNEESARYKQLEPVFFVPHRNRPMIKVGDDWKPGRPKFKTLDEAYGNEADAMYEVIVAEMRAGYENEYFRYERQLARNLDPGLARDNLPVGIFSSCWVTCNLRSALSFLSLRTHAPLAKFVSYPLYEIELAARQLESTVALAFPLCYEAFSDFGRVAP